MLAIMEASMNGLECRTAHEEGIIVFVLWRKREHPPSWFRVRALESGVRAWAKSLQLCPTVCDPVDCSPPGSSVHGILQARTLEWVVSPSSRGSSRPRDQTLTVRGSSVLTLPTSFGQADNLQSFLQFPGLPMAL